MSVTLKVVIVSTQKGWRGGEEQARLLAVGLRERGHQVSLMARRQTPFATRMAEEFNFPVHQFAGRGWNPAAVWGNRRFLRRNQPDIIHINDSHALTAISLAAAGMSQAIRVASRRVMFPIHSTFRYQRFCDQLVCVSLAVADVARQAGLDEQQITVVHDGVAAERTNGGDGLKARRSLGLQTAKVLLTVGALTEDKGHANLLRSMGNVARRHSDAFLLVAGEGPCRQSLQRLIDDLGLQARVRLLGQRDDVPDLLQAADLFVFPAENEGLGSSVIDAMMSLTPVVCTNSGGTAELFGWPHDVTASQSRGWLVPAGDPLQLSQAINSALSDPWESQRRAHEARQYASDNFTAAVMVDRTIALYRNQLCSRRQSAA